MRFDLSVIASWIEPGSTVLDLGCGTGDLLHVLKKEKQVAGTGVELEEEKVSLCVEKGLSVIHGDINEEITDYPDRSFDYVILSQTLQQVYEPAVLISEMLRVGNKGIVSFPNFSHWKNRMQFFFKGSAPVSKELPYEWYNTPNIRVIPIKDFRRFCKEWKFCILKEVATTTHHHEEQGNIVRILPNLLASYGIFLICGKEKS